MIRRAGSVRLSDPVTTSMRAELCRPRLRPRTTLRAISVSIKPVYCDSYKRGSPVRRSLFWYGAAEVEPMTVEPSSAKMSSEWY